jgi:nucleotide-binding universal stress UspA family protein
VSTPSGDESAGALRPPFRTILFPTDLSRTGNLAIDIAYHLAEQGGCVHLMHVCEPPFMGNPVYGPFVQGYVPTPQDTERAEERALEGLHGLVPASAAAREVRTEYHIVHGLEVADVIEEEARRFGADVVVMGTHGRSGLGRLLMGSVATDVVKREGLAVILVRADVESEEVQSKDD